MPMKGLLGFGMQGTQPKVNSATCFNTYKMTFDDPSARLVVRHDLRALISRHAHVDTARNSTRRHQLEFSAIQKGLHAWSDEHRSQGGRRCHRRFLHTHTLGHAPARPTCTRTSSDNSDKCFNTYTPNASRALSGHRGGLHSHFRHLASEVIAIITYLHR